MKEYYKYVCENISPLNNSQVLKKPATYFMSNYTEKVLNVHEIEQNFHNNSKEEIREINVIRYLILHFARNVSLLFESINVPYLIFNVDYPISFKNYCIYQFYYHFAVISQYVETVKEWLKDENINYSIVENNDGFIFSDNIDLIFNKALNIKTVSKVAFPILNKQLLIIESLSSSVKTEINYYFDYSFYSCKEVLFINFNKSLNDILKGDEQIMYKWFSEKFHYSIFGISLQEWLKQINVNNCARQKIILKDKSLKLLEKGYFINHLLKISNQFEQ